MNRELPDWVALVVHFVLGVVLVFAAVFLPLSAYAQTGPGDGWTFCGSGDSGAAASCTLPSPSGEAVVQWQMYSTPWDYGGQVFLGGAVELYTQGFSVVGGDLLLCCDQSASFPPDWAVVTVHAPESSIYYRVLSASAGAGGSSVGYTPGPHIWMAGGIMMMALVMLFGRS